MDYKKGQQIECPHCGREAIVQVKTEMDGWEKLGECLACNICSEKLADLPGPDKKADKPKDDSGKNVFADFLGTDSTLEKNENYLGDVSNRQFCKDCQNFVENPFYTRCMLHEKDVGPMDDCPDYTARKET